MGVRALMHAVTEYENSLSDCLVLNAARNIMSPHARALLGTKLVDGDLAGRPSEWGAQHTAGPARQIEEEALSLIGRLFGTRHAELRALSGSLANGLATASATKPGETVLMPPTWAFGHKSWSQVGYPGTGGRKVVEMPWDPQNFAPDMEGLARTLREVRPKLVVVGLSRPLFPEPMAEVANLASGIGARLTYDGAHVLGLIAGGAFPNPLTAGFDMLTGSTHKTLPGPMGGIVICRTANVLEDVAKVTDAWISSYSNSRIAALAFTLAEMVEAGQAYAAQVVSNARALARALEQHGVNVLGASRGYTATHQVLIDISGVIEPPELVRRMAGATILLNAPSRADRRLRGTGSDGWWVRLGTSAVTRLGMKESDMEIIAGFVAGLILHGKDPVGVATDVADLVSRYQQVQYSVQG